VVEEAIEGYKNPSKERKMGAYLFFPQIEYPVFCLLVPIFFFEGETMHSLQQSRYQIQVEWPMQTIFELDLLRRTTKLAAGGRLLLSVS
jgi:hypothetical protein